MKKSAVSNSSFELFAQSVLDQLLFQPDHLFSYKLLNFLNQENSTNSPVSVTTAATIVGAGTKNTPKVEAMEVEASAKKALTTLSEVSSLQQTLFEVKDCGCWGRREVNMLG